MQKKRLEFRIGKKKIIGLSKTYENVLPQNPLAIIGSRGYLEIAVNCGNARRYFMADRWDTVTVASNNL